MSGDFERHQLDILTALMAALRDRRQTVTLVDVGANIGIHSILAADAGGPNARVFAFEPVLANVELLRRNIEINGATGVTVLREAVGEETGEIRIYLSEKSIGTHSVSLPTGTYETVPLTTIDTFTERTSARVDIIKMDIEGYEPAAIRGAPATLTRDRPVLFLEFSRSLVARCKEDPLRFARELLRMYPYCFVVDERRGRARRLVTADDIARLENQNIVLVPSADLASIVERSGG